MAAAIINGASQAMTPDDETFNALLDRYQSLKLCESHKNVLIEDLLVRYRYMSDRLTQERAEFDRERECTQAKLATTSRHDVQPCLDSDSFVMVLIDGSDLVFCDDFLNSGDMGGRRAAQMLHQLVNEYLFSTIDDLSPETEVYVRVYMDLETLTNECVNAGIVNNSNKMRSFARGFCQHRALFDLINVGSHGRESIIDKVEANLKQNASNLQCRHVIVGCSDSVYTPILRKHADCGSKTPRITLLSALPLAEDMAQLPFESIQFKDLFRSSTIEIRDGNDGSSAVGSPIPVRAPMSPPPGIMTPPLSTRADSRMAHCSLDASYVRSSSTNSSAAESHEAPKPFTWAAVAQKTAALPVSDVSRPSSKASIQSSDFEIKRNRQGQRLDPPPPEYVRDDVNRLKKLKLCNAHYLLGHCGYRNTKCTHDHNYKATAKEVETLKLIARMSACINGSGCEDPTCMYGHRCPFPKPTEGSLRGKACINGDNCRFPPNMHDMDMVAVRTTKLK